MLLHFRCTTLSVACSTWLLVSPNNSRSIIPELIEILKYNIKIPRMCADDYVTNGSIAGTSPRVKSIVDNRWRVRSDNGGIRVAGIVAVVVVVVDGKPVGPAVRGSCRKANSTLAGGNWTARWRERDERWPHAEVMAQQRDHGGGLARHDTTVMNTLLRGHSCPGAGRILVALGLQVYCCSPRALHSLTPTIIPVAITITRMRTGPRDI